MPFPNRIIVIVIFVGSHKLVAPHYYHTQVASGCGCQNLFCPVIGICETFDTCFRYSTRLQLHFGNLTDSFYICSKNSWAKSLIAIHTYEIYVIIAGPSVKKIIFGFLIIHLRGYCVNKLMHTLFVTEIVYSIFPQGNEFRFSSTCVTPPGPRLGMFVERTEYDRY